MPKPIQSALRYLAIGDLACADRHALAVIEAGIGADRQRSVGTVNEADLQLSAVLAGSLLATADYLRGDLALAMQTTTLARDANRQATARPSPPAATSPHWLDRLAVPTEVLSLVAAGRHGAAKELLECSHDEPPQAIDLAAIVHRAELDAVASTQTRSRGRHTNPDPLDLAPPFDHGVSTTTRVDLKPEPDTRVGAAILARIHGSHPPTPIEARPLPSESKIASLDVTSLAIDVLATIGPVGSTVSRSALPDITDRLAAAVSAGNELSLFVPLSLRRALAQALLMSGRPEEAAEQLASAERLWRAHGAYVELVEVLLQSATVQRRLGRGDSARAQASEAYDLATRIGLPAAIRRARAVAPDHSSTRLESNDTEERMIMLSDVVGSTTVSTLLGDHAYYDLVMEHHVLVRRLLVEHGGIEFSEGGDSLFAWFEQPEDAFDCALAIQGEVIKRSIAGGMLSVRVSLTGGDPFFRDGRPFGSVVNRAARLIAHAEPNGIIVDEATLECMEPIFGRFNTRTLDLRDFGEQTIGVYTP